MAGSRARSTTVRLAVGIVLVLVYALPLFVPPAPLPLGMATAADAGLLARILPGVPTSWMALRLLALAVAAVLLAGTVEPVATRGPAEVVATAARPRSGRRWLALGLAAVHLAAAPWAGALGPLGQTIYLVMLAVPAVVLARAPVGPIPWRRLLPSALVILVWAGWCLRYDLGSPRVADVIDGWRGWLDVLNFVGQRKNLLGELFDPNLPGMGGVLLFFHGMPLYQAGVLAPAFPSVQLFQIGSVALCAAGVGLLARSTIGAGVAPIAIAVFLFAPYTRFVTLFPGPFLAGPLYATAVALATWVACQRRSEAALAALGACTGIAVQFPGVLPIVALCGGLTVWHLRGELPRLWIAAATGAASCLAAVVPALGTVLNPSQLAAHFRWDGLITIIDAGLLGQLPVGTTPAAYEGVVARPFDIVVAALLAPFAHPRIGIRLWGDALFDPVGAALIAVGLVACVRSLRRSALAVAALLFFFAALSPAFVSPVDVVDIVHAVALPVPAALLAGLGIAAIARRFEWRLTDGVALAVAAVVGLGGATLFDVVNPSILSASSFGLMFQVVRPEDADRVVVVSYGPRFFRPTKTLYVGPVTAFAGPRPVGYLEWDDADLPAEGFAHEGKDLLFWSHGFDQEFTVRETVCRQWPGATLYEIRDRAGLGRVHAARLGGAPWEPRDAGGRWLSWDCTAERARQNAPAAARGDRSGPGR